jgi:phage tail P2-like protein
MTDTLLPVNAHIHEIALELASAKLAQLPIDVGKLWNPDDCPEQLLPWLAWAMSIDEWDSRWSEQTRRTQIKNAVYTHRQKGTVGAVKRALAAVGVTVDFLEWFEDVNDVVLAPVHNTQPHTFVFIAWANENPYSSQQVFLNPQLYDTIKRIVHSHKPVRSHFDFLVGAKLDSQLFVATTSTGWSQVSRTCHQTVAVQIAPSHGAIGVSLTTCSQNVAVNRQPARTMPVQVPRANSKLSTAIAVSRQRYAVSRFYLHG